MLTGKVSVDRDVKHLAILHNNNIIIGLLI